MPEIRFVMSVKFNGAKKRSETSRYLTNLKILGVV